MTDDKPAYGEVHEAEGWEHFEDVTRQHTSSYESYDEEATLVRGLTYPDPEQVARIAQIEDHFGCDNCQNGKCRGDTGYYGIYVRSSTRADKGDPPPEKVLPAAKAAVK